MTLDITFSARPAMFLAVFALLTVMVSSTPTALTITLTAVFPQLFTSIFNRSQSCEAIEGEKGETSPMRFLSQPLAKVINNEKTIQPL